jgi:hypothetical protein
MRSGPSCGCSIGDGGSGDKYARGAGMLGSSDGATDARGETGAGSGPTGVTSTVGTLPEVSFGASFAVSFKVPVPEPDEEARLCGMPPLENRAVLPELLRTLFRLLSPPTTVELVAVPVVCALPERTWTARLYNGEVGETCCFNSLPKGCEPKVGEVGEVGGEVFNAAEYHGIGGSPRSLCIGSTLNVTGVPTLSFRELGGGGPE